MTLEEATGASLRYQRRGHARAEETADTELADFARAVHLMDYHVMLDKLRREKALQDAIQRGLDRAGVTSSSRRKARTFSRRRMNPERHARVLLRETSMRFREIAEITGLDIYTVVGLKLKMRNPLTDV